jgi:predicted metal-dependent hydrolase
MSQVYRQVAFGSALIEFTLQRRSRTTLEISVEPDTSVAVVAPHEATNEEIDAKIRKRAPWIRRQQRYFAQFLPRTPERKYVTGETHRYLGRQYRLKVIRHVEADARLVHGYIVIQSPSPERVEVTRDLVEGWYRRRALQKFAERLEINLDRFSRPDAFRPSSIIVRQLTHRWGSMSPCSKLLLNRKLVEAPVDTIDYVITHELCHIKERQHSTAFFKLLSRVMPDWEKRKRRLELAMA